MDPQLQALYARVKAREIGPEEAAKQFALWRARHQQGGERPMAQGHETLASARPATADDLLGTVLAALMQAASGVLGVDARDLDSDVRLHEYGFDQVKMGELFTSLGEIYGLALSPELLREFPTLHGVAKYLVEAFEPLLRERLRTDASHEFAAPVTDNPAPTVAPDAAVADHLRDRVVHYFKGLLSSFLKIPVQSLEAEAALEQYGINSVLIVELTAELEKLFGPLPKTLFFEYQSLGELTDYFLAYHKERLKALLDGAPQATAPKASAAAPPGEWRQQQVVTTPAAKMARHQTTAADAQGRPLQQPSAAPRAPSPRQPRQDIFDVAIIGQSGRYPGADNLAQFWENLKVGRHAITEIPRDRWDWRAYFDAEKGKLGSIYTKWGGFLSEIDTFDPLFFRISPAEAQSMDPQERLFIEETYAAIEDAGYTPATLGERDATAGRTDRRIGVFVGVMNSTYGGNARYWSIANRVSYLFDLQGPSLAVDTACSSSLTAIHLALESLYRGDCTCAIAGGVNVIVDPIHFQGLAAMTMLSPTGQCKPFGDGADGFVGGEGVGVVLLKPLARAIEDRDHIYGVIKGSAVNAGGKTNGYTVPNPRAQGRVVAEAIEQAGVDPRTISYVEAHGTGTALGDPIEIAGLSQAFAQAAGAARPGERQFCCIGSVKSNIGHLESAAGIAGLTKVLLQLQHRQLVPSLHATVLNPGIDFAHSPFIVQRELAEWPRPLIEVDGEVREYPRIAGISSFGAGGANAHLIVTEYEGDGAADAPPSWPSDRAGADADRLRPALIVLSAKSEAQLQERVRRLQAVLREDGRAWSDRDLADLAYTLQVGREAMEERLALLVYSAVELAGKLALFLEGRDDAPGLFRGRAGGASPARLPPDLAADEDVRLALGAWVAKGKYDKLLSLWAKGLAIDWDELLYARTAGDQHVREKPRRLSLPTYPFAKERYWARSATQVNGPSAAGADGTADAAAATPEPLVVPPTGTDPTGIHLGGLRPLPPGEGRGEGSWDTQQAWGRPHPNPLPEGEGTVRQQEEVSAPAGTVGTDLLREKTAAYLTQLIAPVLGLPAHRLAVDVSLGQYGMDSVMAMQLTAQLEKTFGSLSKTLLFEYQDIRALSAFFNTSYRDRLQDLLGGAPEAVPGAGTTATPDAPAVDRGPSPLTPRSSRSEQTATVDAGGPFRHRRFLSRPSPTLSDTADIAVIGLAGRYPQANTLDEFWENLRTGRDCITEIPPERWDHRRYFEPSGKKPGKAYSKWGGFLDGVDRFDPLFFNIAPRDAELMDPQERLFLECTWHLLENAGYTRASLRARERSKVGVYVGAMSQQYHAFDADLIRESAIALSSYYSIANRVSYFFDFQGPSLAVDTACSSALVAVHMACDSLLKGECRLAIAGGVNLSIHPKKYLALSLAQIVGSHADSRSFADGDGYLPAEGVGAVLLKPLAQAVRDGDAILALIKSSAVNHSGHTHGYSVPNPSAQAQLIVDNFRKAGIDPRTVSYVESAANGSALGDPIEVKALTMAFREFTADQGFCAIGSVKSNIGHAEAASGMSQLTKVILQLRHGLLVPSIKAEPLNPNLSFEGSPFYLQRQLSAWRRPVLDGVGECSRRATISSIGAGGTNAHLIVEEYVNEGVGPQSTQRRSGGLATDASGDFCEESAMRSADPHSGGSRQAAGVTHTGADAGPVAAAAAPQIVVLSARNRERLRAVAEQMLAFVRRHSDCSLADLAYTLQVGREAMTSRLAMVVTSRDDLAQGLEEFLQAVAASAQVKPGALAASVPMFAGDLEGDGAEIRSLLAGKAGEAVAQVFLAEGNLEKLALHWTQGGDVPWEALHAGKSVSKIPLPSYPFSRERYWIVQEVLSADGDALTPSLAVNPPLPPGEGWGEGSRGIELTWGPPHPDPLPEGEGSHRRPLVTPEPLAMLPIHDQIVSVLTAILSEELGIPAEAIRPQKTFQDYGADSIAVLKMARGIEEIFGAKVSGREMLEYPSVASLSRHLAAKLDRKTPSAEPERAEPEATVAETAAPLDGAARIGLNPWGSAVGDLCDDALLHHVFVAQARKSPDRTAVVWNEACLSYRELDVKSTQLASYLQQQGVEPDTVVGLYLARSLDMIVGVLGVLKAGAAYVPLDPALAEGRIEHIVRDSGMSMLLAHASTSPHVAALQHNHPTSHVIDLDRLWPDIERGGAQALPPRLDGANLAYMIYTSGSTGQPKGVMIPHGAAARQCEVVRERWAIDVETRVLQFTPLSFDASVEQIFATLSAGATLVLADPTPLAPRPFSDMLAAQRIDILNVPPAFALELLREWQRRPELIPGSLRLLVTGGDVLAVEAVRLWQTLLQGRVALLNAYGPTETTVTACLHTLSAVSETDTKVPIGRPLGDRQVYILDHDGRPTPPGGAGEIYIGGMGLARGYRRRPALTAAAFVPHPFTDAPGTRLFRSGDLGRFLPDGGIEFLGRLDHQVKVRGYRIELGEIEAALAGHPAVAQAAVVTLDGRDDRRLVGYVVPKNGQEPDLQELQRYLRRNLPAYMIPSRFVVLERLPLTASGKIDRLALPAPPKLDGPAVAPPRDEVERQLAGIWEELLDVGRPSIHDDFFASGGHSILAIRLLALIRDRFGVELPLAALLQAPTITDLAEMLRGDTKPQDFTHLVALQKGSGRPFFCVPGVGGTVFYFLKLAGLLGRGQPFYGLQSRGLDGVTEPYTSVESIAGHYIQAIQRVQPQGPYLLGGHSFGGHIAFEMAVQLEAMGHEVGALALIDCPAPASLNLNRTWDESALLLAFASILGIRIGDNPGLVRTLLGPAEREDKLAAIYDEVTRLDAFPLRVEMVQFRGLFQVYLTNSLMQYSPRRRLEHTPITLLAAERPHSEALLNREDFARIADEAALLQRLASMSAAWAEYDRELRRLWGEDSALGWGRFSARPVQVRRVPGSHMDMIHEPHVHALAALLSETIRVRRPGEDTCGGEGQEPHATAEDRTAPTVLPREEAPAASPTVKPVAAAYYPLSKVQEGLWLLQKFSPQMSAYNVPVAIRFGQGFDAELFRATCAFLLEQYPILGSRFVEVDGEPRQYIPAQRPLTFTQQAIDHLNERDLVPFLSARVKEPFDLERGPLMCVQLFSREQGPKVEHIGLITIHHIVFDGTSSILLARALVSAYHALSRGEAPERVTPEASYRDFVDWEQAMLAGPEGREHLGWWRQHLAGELPVLALRTDHPRPAVRRFNGATLEATLDPALSEQLRALARSQRVSLSTLLLGLYKVLLHRYTGQEDLIVGMPTMGRPKHAFDQVMGCFINMLAVRSRVSGEQSFVDYLKTLQLTILDGLDHAVYPFSELVRELKVDRDQSISPIFQAYYAYQNYVTPGGADVHHAASQGVLQAEFLTGIHQEGDKDLGLEVYEEADRFTLNIKYNPDLYEAATIQRLLGHLTQLAATVVRQPYESIAGYDIFSAEQRAEMLRDWNDTARPFPQAQRLFELFEEQAAKTPDCTAVVFKDQSLTYAGLERRSRALAAYLQRQGIGPETFVGLFLERSMEIVTGAMGILRAGGVYVPLDPALPEERLAYMLEDARVVFLLTTEALAARAQAFKSRIPTLKILDLDQDWPAIERYAALYTPPALHPGNLAYVIYTSGSTGRPKGVMISHLTTTRHCHSLRDYFRMAPGERVCLQSPIAFDASVEQIFAPLSVGATVAIRDLEVLAPKPFSAMLADLKVNVIQLPPAFILALLREWQLNPHLIPADLKLLVSCGDVLAVETVRLWQVMLKDRVTLLNVYGPTEVTAKATFHQVDPDLKTQALARIPIGRPLANKKIYILDRYAQPTPVGVPGELHIGGTGPGRGYHGRPGLTAEKFIPDPFSAEPGARLYNAGDLAYYRHDGTIEFLGRTDHQVKVRGHRIELGEIEAVLAGHPDVKSAAVITVDMREDKRLVAYLVAQDGRALAQGDLKSFVGRHLPDYMVPSAFVCLEQMPLTPSGKINRRGLPLPEGVAREDAVAPRDAVELELRRIWEEVLEREDIDIRQDFFALGGHSLLAIRLMVLIEERLGRELPLATLFQAPTIEQLAGILRAQGAEAEPALVCLQALGSSTPFFCVPGAGGTALYLNDLARHLGLDRPVYAFQAKGLDGRSEPYDSVPRIAEHYIRAVRAVQPEGPYLLGGHSFGGRVAFEMSRALEQMGQTVQQLVLLDCSAPQPDDPGRDWDETALLLAFAAALGLDIGGDLDLLAGLVADRELDRQLERLLRTLKQHDLVLPDTRMARLRGLFQVFNANNRMTYVPGGPIKAGITLFKAGDFQPRVIDDEYFRRAIDDPAILARIATMNRTWARFNAQAAMTREDPHLGWDRYTTAAVTTHQVPGDHMTLVREPHVQVLASVMRASILSQ
jgi:amino acid adenylation domain-containing protein